MNGRFYHVTLISFLLVMPATTLQGEDGESRSWSTTDGFLKVEAVFVQKKEDKIVLRRNDTGKTIEISLRRLSEEDREFVDEMQSRNDTPEESKVDDEARVTESTRNSVSASLLQPWSPRKADLAQAPPDFQKKGMEIENEIKARGGFAVAGQVVEKKGYPLKRDMFAVVMKRTKNDAEDAHRFESGWFVTPRMTAPEYDKLVVATFQHYGVEVPLKIEQGKVNFFQVFVERIPNSKLTSIHGYVQNEAGQPIDGICVSLFLTRSNCYFTPPAIFRTVTAPNGRYAITGIVSQPYYLSIQETRFNTPRSSSLVGTKYSSRRELQAIMTNHMRQVRSEALKNPPAQAHSSTGLELVPGNNRSTWATATSGNGLTRQENDRFVSTLLFQRKVMIDVLYQPDGSTDFTRQNVQKKRYVLGLLNSDTIAVANQKIGDCVFFDTVAENSDTYEADLKMCIQGGTCCFALGTDNDKGGLYALEKRNFDAVKEADPGRIQTNALPCVTNHVYVVRTNKGRYAKFVVQGIEIVTPNVQ